MTDAEILKHRSCEFYKEKDPSARKARGYKTISMPKEDELRVEARHFVTWADGSKVTALYDFGVGKSGISIPKEVFQNNIGFASQKEAEVFRAKMRIYIQDIKRKPVKKRAGSTANWK